MLEFLTLRGLKLYVALYPQPQSSMFCDWAPVGREGDEVINSENRP